MADMRGLSWFAVEVTTRSLVEASTPSQAHPDPKRPAAAPLNFPYISSMEPKALSIAALSSADGPLVFEGAPRTVQKNVWFQWPPALFLTVVAKSEGISPLPTFSLSWRRSRLARAGACDAAC